MPKTGALASGQCGDAVDFGLWVVKAPQNCIWPPTKQLTPWNVRPLVRGSRLFL